MTESLPRLEKIVKLGTVLVPGTSMARTAPIYCKITIKADGELSITGVEGPLRDGNCLGSCGQIVMGLGDGSSITPAEGWTSETVLRFLATWEHWHLNHMRAGTPAQSEHLRRPDVRAILDADRLRWFDNAVASLASAGLQPDMTRHRDGSPLGEPTEAEVSACRCDTEICEAACVAPDRIGYSYGSRWLREDLPADVEAWLAALPDSPDVPAWV